MLLGGSKRFLIKYESSIKACKWTSEPPCDHLACNGKMKTNWLGKNFSKKNCVRSLIERSKVGYLIIRISGFGL